MNSGKIPVDTGWTLFLDRDGVINRRIVDGYITDWASFAFIQGVKEAMAHFAELFEKIIVVTNQQGIGKKIMTEADLLSIHQQLINEVEQSGGRIDAILYSPFLQQHHSFTRKPAVGMALKARQLFPEIHFKKSIMAGDSLSDMLFGRKVGMKTVFISTDVELARKGFKLIDAAYPDLITFAGQLSPITTP